MFSNPLFIAFLGAMASLFIWMGITRPKRSAFEEDVAHAGLYARNSSRLITAGLTETSPMLIVSSTIIIMTGIFILGSLFFNNVIVGVALSLITPVVVWCWLHRQKKKF